MIRFIPHLKDAGLLSRLDKIPLEIHDSVFITASRCIRCDAKLDATTGVMSDIPKEGDISICSYCGKVMIFTNDKKLRAATDEEMKDFKEVAPYEFFVTERISGWFEARKAKREN